MTETTRRFVREPAKRIFAEEFNSIEKMTTIQHEGMDKKTKIAISPSGEHINRIFFVGAITEIEDIGNDSPYLRGRVSDPTGTITIYAGQYQPEALASLSEIETDLPAFVALTGKANAYVPTDSPDKVIMSVRPEHIVVSDSETRDIWVAETLELTKDRIRQIMDIDPESETVEKLTAMVHKAEEDIGKVQGSSEPAPAPVTEPNTSREEILSEDPISPVETQASTETPTENSAGIPAEDSAPNVAQINGLTEFESDVLYTISDIGKGKIVGVPSIAKALNASTDDVEEAIRILGTKGMIISKGYGLVQALTEFENAETMSV